MDSYYLQRGTQVIRFLPSLNKMQWCEYKNNKWTVVYEENNKELFQLRNNYKHYIKKGFRPKS